MNFRGIAGDDRRTYPLGYEGHSILEVEITTPFYISPYRCDVVSCDMYRAKNGRSPDGGIDASIYYLTRFKMFGIEEEEEYSYAFLSDLIIPSTGMTMLIANGRRCKEIIAMCGDNIIIINNNLKKALRKEIGIISYMINFRYAYSLVVSECVRLHFSNTNHILAANDDRNFDSMLYWMERAE